MLRAGISGSCGFARTRLSERPTTREAKEKNARQWNNDDDGSGSFGSDLNVYNEVLAIALLAAPQGGLP